MELVSCLPDANTPAVCRSADQVRRVLTSDRWVPRLAITGDLNQYALGPVLLTMEPQEHDRYKAELVPAFGPRAVAAWAPRIESVAEQLLKTSRAAGWRLGDDFARPLAARVALSFVGLDVTREDEIRKLVDPIFQSGTLRAAQLARIGVRLFRIFKADTMEGELLADGELIPLLFRQSNSLGLDLRSSAVTVLIAGTEPTARAVLASIAAVGKREGETKSLPEICTDAIRSAGIFPVVQRESSAIDDRSTVLGLSLNPVETSGEERAYPFGFGRHFCLGANWVRQVCVSAVTAWMRQPSVPKLDEVFQEDTVSFIGGITEIRTSC